MHLHRTVNRTSTFLASLACLVLASCSISTHSGTAPKAPAQERKAKSSNKAPSKPKKKQEEPPSKKVTPTEIPKKDGPTSSKDEDLEKATDSSTKEKQTPPRPGMSRLIVPIEVPLSAVEEKLDEELPKTESRDWKRVTKKSKKYDVDVRYEVWREPIQLSMKGNTLRAVIPVRYASEFRAKADKPIGKGSFWLTHGETWGTKEHQQRMEVTIDLSLSMTEDYKLESHSKLVSIEHGAPPSGNACAKAGVEICVPKKDLASYVEDELNDRLGKKLEKALKKGDAKVGKLFDLRKRVSTLWTGLSTPVELQKPNQLDCPTVVGEACSSSAWLTFSPNTLGLSPLERRGSAIGVRVELQGKLAVTADKPNRPQPELPKLQSITGGTAFELATNFEIPITQVTAQIDKALAATPIRFGSTSLKLKSATLSVTDGAKKTVALEIVTEKDQKLGFEATLDYDTKKKLLKLAQLVPSASTRALLEKELKGLDLAELEKAIDKHATVALDKASGALQKAVTDALGKSLPGKLRLKGTLSEVALEDFSLSAKAITAKIALSGPLSVEFTP